MICLSPNWFWLTEADSSILRAGGDRGLLSLREGDTSIAMLDRRWFYLREGDSVLFRLREWVYCREGDSWVVRLPEGWRIAGKKWRIRLGRAPRGV